MHVVISKERFVASPRKSTDKSSQFVPVLGLASDKLLPSTPHNLHSKYHLKYSLQFTSSLPSSQSSSSSHLQGRSMHCPSVHRNSLLEHFNIAQSFSSLLSSQSGRPLHCHDRGMHTLLDSHLKRPTQTRVLSGETYITLL